MKINYGSATFFYIPVQQNVSQNKKTLNCHFKAIQ